MDRVLTVAEIEARSAPERVRVGEPETDENLSPRVGKVLIHRPDRDEVDRKATALRRGRFAVPYPENWPAHMALIL